MILWAALFMAALEIRARERRCRIVCTYDGRPLHPNTLLRLAIISLSMLCQMQMLAQSIGLLPFVELRISPQSCMRIYALPASHPRFNVAEYPLSPEPHVLQTQTAIAPKIPTDPTTWNAIQPFRFMTSFHLSSPSGSPGSSKPRWPESLGSSSFVASNPFSVRAAKDESCVGTRDPSSMHSPIFSVSQTALSPREMASYLARSF